MTGLQNIRTGVRRHACPRYFGPGAGRMRIGVDWDLRSQLRRQRRHRRYYGLRR